MVFLCVGSYLLSPKWQAVRAEYQRQRDPLHQFASQQTRKRSFRHCRIKSVLIHKTANSGRYWASIICGKTITAIRCWRTVRRCNYVVRTLNCMRRWRRCCITASQHMTVRARAMIDKALALDSNEITALMLLASDAFMQANYAQAIELWQK